jgi:hypothetical protein
MLGEPLINPIRQYFFEALMSKTFRITGFWHNPFPTILPWQQT